MRVLITGGGGFIGSHLVEDQLKRAREVIAVDLKVESLRHLAANPNLKLLQGDFTDWAFLDPYLDGLDICFHLASAHLETGVEDEYFWQLNMQGARDLVERCHVAGVGRFVHCSSVGVFGDLKNPPADEESECNPDLAYEKSKLAGEKAVLDYACEHGVEVVVIRPAWVYGPGCPRTEKLFRMIEKRRFFFVGNEKTLRHPIYIDDMVQGFEIAGTHDRAVGEIFIMAGPRAVPLIELAGEIARVVGTPPPSLTLPKGLVWAGCYALEAGFSLIGREAPFTRRSLKFFTGNTSFCTKKAEQLLGFRAATDVPEGVSKTRQWLLESEL